MLNIALFGPPGAGKGTQSSLLMQKYNLTYISTGDILREEINKGSEIGLKVKAVIEKGGLASDEMIVRIIENKIKENTQSSGFLFDGFPRTVVQAYILEGLLHKMHTSLTCMLSLEVPENDLITRLLERGKTSSRADDSNVEIIKFRLEEYNNKTLPVAEFYNDLDKYYPIDGTGTIDEVCLSLKSRIQSLLKQEWYNIVVSGPPGSGKGTQCELLAKKYNFVHISTGDLLRKEICENSELGQKAKEYILRGELVPDEIVIRLIERKIAINNDAHGFLFDGFPVNLVQAYILDGLLRKHSSSIATMLYLKVPTLQSIRRLIERGKTGNAREYDANAEIVIHRLENYEQTSELVKEYYETQGKRTIIDADANVNTVLERLSDKIDEILMLKDKR